MAKDSQPIPLGRVLRLAAAAVLIALAVWLHRLAVGIADGPSRWMLESRKFTKHLSWSELCDATAIVAALVALLLIGITFSPEGGKGRND